MAKPPDDFDSPWKKALEWYFEDFMAFFFPEAHAAINWGRPVEFMDKEFQQAVEDAEIGRRYADKLGKIWTKLGHEEWVLAHVEVQGEPEVSFDERMYIYHYRIYDKFRRQVASFAVLGDERAGWRPGAFGYELLGSRLSFVFQTCKLRDFRDKWTELEASDNPFATVVMAHLKAQETRHTPQARYNAKFALIRRLYERGYRREDVLKLFNFIDWVMRLPDELDAEFWTELRQYEEATRMEYVTSVERIGIEKGRELGRQEGHQEGRQDGLLLALLRLYNHRFGPAPAAIQSYAQALTAEELARAIDIALIANNAEDFAAQLPGYANALSNTQGIS